MNTRKDDTLNFDLTRKVLERGALMGHLTVEGVKVCDTLERKGGELEPGTYQVMVSKCVLQARKMLFLEPVDDEDSAELDSAELDSAELDSATACVVEQAPCKSICQRCLEERKTHEMAHLAELHAIPCRMMQPGNGVFNLRQGAILVGEAHAPGYMLKSQELFLALYGRIQKAISRGKKVVINVQ